MSFFVRKWQKWGHFAQNMKQYFCEIQIILEFTVPFRSTYGSMISEKRKALKSFLKLGTRQLSRTNSFRLGNIICNCTKKDGNYRLVENYRGLNQQFEKTCWHLPRINEVIHSTVGNRYFLNIDLWSRYFKMALEEESQN